MGKWVYKLINLAFQRMQIKHRRYELWARKQIEGIMQKGLTTDSHKNTTRAECISYLEEGKYRSYWIFMT